MSKQKRLYYFGFQRLEPMLDKGNVWYVRHFERYFDEVNVLYLCGASANVSQGKSHLVSLGSKRRWRDLALAPFRLLSFIRKNGSGVFLTADAVFGWWLFLLARLTGRKLVLMPVCIPEDIYRDSGRSLSGLPIPLERLLTRLTFAMAHTVLTGRCFGSFVSWLETLPAAKGKLLVVDAVADALPSPGFLERLESGRKTRSATGPMTLIYVGRLHKEKLVEDLLHLMHRLASEGFGPARVRLLLIGDGPEREALEKTAIALGVANSVEFAGALANEAIPSRLMTADVFVSPLTGTSLREAALCGLPIVAYDRDWLSGLLKHEETALLVPSRDVAGMAEQVRRLVDDPVMATRLAEASRNLAAKLWSPDAVTASMAELEAHLAR